jgi:Holliday junction resolvase RusA-like endonuclease
MVSHNLIEYILSLNIAFFNEQLSLRMFYFPTMRFVDPHVPKAQQRPGARLWDFVHRAWIPHLRARGWSIRFYDRSKQDKVAFLHRVHDALPAQPFEGPVTVTLDFYFKAAHPAGDLDNLIKFVLDCLNGRAYLDDSQVVRIIAAKHFSADENKTVLKVETMEPQAHLFPGEVIDLTLED